MYALLAAAFVLDIALGMAVGWWLGKMWIRR